jgi:peptide/nickel transport system substrate-binding protein
MKRLFLTIGLVALLLFAAACAPAQETPAEPAPAEPAQPELAQPEPAQPEPEPEPEAEEEPAAAPTEAPEPTAVPEPTEPPAQPAQEPVVILQSIDPTTLDPYFRTQIPENNVMLAVFDLLVMWDDEGNVVPHIATEWEQVEELTWEFKIREGIVAHNGETIDANDVVFSFERAVDPDVGATGTLPWIFGNIQYESAEVIDDYTVHIHTSAPVPELPSFMKEMFIIPQEYYESTPVEETALNPVGSGPYRFVEWQRGDQIRLEAFEDYWGGAPEIQEVIWRAVPETAARIAELNTGGADIIVNVPPDQGDQVDQNMAQVVTIEGLRRIFIGYVYYGPNADLIGDVRVRQALNYAIDFQKIIDAILNGNGSRTGTFANPPFQAPGVDPYPYDPERALELLAEAGVEDRNGDGLLDRPDGSTLELTLQSPSGRYVKDSDIAQAVAAELRAIGLQTEVETLDWSIYAGQLGNQELTGDMYLLGAGTGFNCQGDLSDWYTGSGWGPGQWNDEPFDTLFEELIGTIDPAERERLCFELQEYMYEEVPLIFLYFQVDYYGASNRMDWTPEANERIYIYRASLVD